LSRYVDDMASPEEARIIERHLDACNTCSDRVADYRQVRAAMKSMPQVVPSQHLVTRLQVLASREQARRVSRMTFAQKWESWRDRIALSLNNLLRPLAVPVAGGFVSACLLFGMLVPDLTSEFHPVQNDVPAPQIYTEASVNASMLDSDRINGLLMPIAINESEIVLDVHLDDQGRMTEYRVVSGQALLRNDLVRRRLESTLLVTQFNPATSFGQPTFGKIRVRLVRNEIDVRG
jgi:hypothetical protein